ncbi:MAG: DNA primase, partial [Chitinophagaceae bacterium]|nr:DNA primase [Chitinophagaceae bacterium]
NVKLVLLPENEDPDSYVNKVGAAAFSDYVKSHKKDIILFQLEVSMKEAGQDATKKSEVINRIAESISKINKVEDFTKQQDYIHQCAEILKIDESGLHALVNKFIREKVIVEQRRIPAEEAQQTAPQAGDGKQNYDDATFSLLFRDDLQEKEVAKMLLEYGTRQWDDKMLVAEYILHELVEEELIDNKAVLQLIQVYKKQLEDNPQSIGSNYFIYHENPQLSALAVSLLNVPYVESEYWKKEINAFADYNASLFQKPYKEFIELTKKENRDELNKYLKSAEDKSLIAVQSAVNYLKLRKIKRLILENQADLEKPHNAEELHVLHEMHKSLKKMEIDLAKEMGTVIIK